jgi:hypothetical protein
MEPERITFFNLSETELSGLSDEELETINRKIVFVRDAMPDAWLDHAAELKKSAEALWRYKDEGLRVKITGIDQRLLGSRKFPSISRPYILLAGFALENLIKGLLVALDPSHINEGKLSKDLRSHNLLRLLSKIPDLSLDEDEHRFCRIAQDAIPYWGRYPIPLQYHGVMPEIAIDDDQRQAFLRLHSKLSRRIYEAIRDGWDSGVGPMTLKYRDAQYGDVIEGDEPLFEQSQ